MDFYVRRAVEEDVDLIREAAAVVFPATYLELIGREQVDYMMDWMYSEESLRQQFAQGHVYFLALAPDGRVAGYVSYQREGERLFHLQKIYVLPEYQGFGLGQRLFHVIEDEVRKIAPEGATMELNVNRENPALNFYLRMGMHIARQGDFEIGNGYYMNDYIMSKEV